MNHIQFLACQCIELPFPRIFIDISRETRSHMVATKNIAFHEFKKILLTIIFVFKRNKKKLFIIQGNLLCASAKNGVLTYPIIIVNIMGL